MRLNGTEEFIKNSEAAHRSANTLDSSVRDELIEMDDKEAKQAGENLPLRENRKSVKYKIMEEVVRAKFSQAQICCRGRSIPETWN